MRRIGKKPDLAIEGEGPYGIFRQRIADVQVTAFAIARQIVLLVQGIFPGSTRQGAFQYLAHVGFQPGFDGGQWWQA